jgi:hypothetical protein
MAGPVQAWAGMGGILGDDPGTLMIDGVSVTGAGRTGAVRVRRGDLQEPVGVQFELLVPVRGTCDYAPELGFHCALVRVVWWC